MGATLSSRRFFCEFSSDHILGMTRREWWALHKSYNNEDDHLKARPVGLSQKIRLRVIVMLKGNKHSSITMPWFWYFGVARRSVYLVVLPLVERELNRRWLLSRPRRKGRLHPNNRVIRFKQQNGKLAKSSSEIPKEVRGLVEQQGKSNPKYHAMSFHRLRHHGDTHQ